MLKWELHRKRTRKHLLASIWNSVSLKLTEAFRQPKCSDINMIDYLTFPQGGPQTLMDVLKSRRLEKVWRVKGLLEQETEQFGGRGLLREACAKIIMFWHSLKEGEDSPSSSLLIAAQLVYFEGFAVSEGDAQCHLLESGSHTWQTEWESGGRPAKKEVAFGSYSQWR